MNIRRTCGALLLLMGISFPAFAEDREVSYTPFDLAAGKISIPGAKGPVNDLGCDTTINVEYVKADSVLKFPAGGCGVLANNDLARVPTGLKAGTEDVFLKPVEAKVATNKQTGSEENPGIYYDGTIKQELTIIEIDADQQEFAYFSIKQDKWVIAKAQGTIPREGLAVGSVVYARLGGVLQKWVVQGNTLTGDKKVNDEGCPQCAPTPPPPPPFDCDEQRPEGTAVLICIDTYGDQMRMTSARSQIIRPNTTVAVRVRYRGNLTLKVEQGGHKGIFTPGFQDYVKPQPAPPSGVPKAQADQDKKIKEKIVTFAPRKPGDADIKVKLMDKAKNNEVVYEETIELIVEKTYLGALRLGVGMVFGDAVTETFAAETLPGSSQAEIAQTTNNAFNSEVVLGIAPYAFDWSRGGRSYHADGGNSKFAPYIGVGLLNTDRSSLDILSSIHIGLEWEAIPSVSIAATVVGREVTRLRNGFEVGDPVMETVPTTKGYEFGFGLVLNLSPEFLKLAKQNGSSFF